MKENVTKHRHEEATTAVDREVHQDHYHTSIQPVKDREVLPEQHSHHMASVEQREYKHGDDHSVRARLEQERAQFQNTRTQGATQETHSAAPVIAGEHVHHHVHEVNESSSRPRGFFTDSLQTIQPVVQKETIQPSVVHTTVPIHEVHQNEAKHHSASALPAVSMADFKKQGGSLTGREERYDGFEGEPRAVSSALGGSSTTGTHTGIGSTTTAGPHQSNFLNKADPRGTYPSCDVVMCVANNGSVDSDMDGSRNMGAADGTRTGAGVGHTGTAGGYDSGRTGTTATGKKPGLMDKLNPMKDSDGDGRKGVME